MEAVMTEPGVHVNPRAERGELVHIWSGGGHVLCKSQHPLVVVRFDCVSLFLRDSLCQKCLAAWE